MCGSCSYHNARFIPAGGWFVLFLFAELCRCQIIGKVIFKYSEAALFFILPGALCQQIDIFLQMAHKKLSRYIFQCYYGVGNPKRSFKKK